MLCQYGADLNIADYEGTLPLHNSSLHAKADTTQILLASGAKRNVTDLERVAPLHLASSVGNPQTVELLCNFGADVDILTKRGETALHLASKHGHFSTVAVLLKACASLTLRNNDGKTAYELCTAEGTLKVPRKLYKDTASLLLVAQHCLKVPLHKAIFFGQLSSPLVSNALASSSCIQMKLDNRGNTILHYIAHYQQYKVLELLDVEELEDVNIQNKDGLTPLHVAVATCDAAMFRALLDLGGSLSVHDKRGITPAHMAAELSELTHFCVANDINIMDETLRDKHGDTPFDYQYSAAVWSGNVSQANLLASRVTSTTNLVLSPGKLGFDLDSACKCVCTLENDRVYQAVVRLTQHLTKSISDRFPRFSCDAVLVESNATNTTIGLPSKYYFLFELQELSRNVTVVNTCNSDTVKLRVDDDERHTWIDSVTGENISICVKDIFFEKLCGVFANSDFIDDNVYLDFSGTGSNIKWKNSCLVLRVLWRGVVYKRLRIILDITPSVVVNGRPNASLDAYPPSCHSYHVIPKPTKHDVDDVTEHWTVATSTEKFKQSQSSL